MKSEAQSWEHEGMASHTFCLYPGMLWFMGASVVKPDTSWFDLSKLDTRIGGGGNRVELASKSNSPPREFPGEVRDWSDDMVGSVEVKIVMLVDGRVLHWPDILAKPMDGTWGVRMRVEL